ncbi:MAG: DNA topoisomerase IV subunit A [Thermodesulfobacteriota bacterium]
MTDHTDYGELQRLFHDNFIEYSSYVIKERAIPDLRDGLKPVQRRILQTLHNMDDGRFHKVANVVGESMKLHPHGDASIYAALVNLANRGYLIDRQGNFGNIYTGDQASAARYIECRLSPLARETLFNRDLTEFVDSYDGRMQEPVTLPAKLPLLLMQGVEGIAVGMATKIMPHNFVELLEAQKKILRGEEFVVYPDFQTGGILDVSAYGEGNGRLKCRARIEERDEKTVVIREIPYGTTTQSLIDSVEKATRSGKIKIVSINDYTAEDVEIEIKLPRGIYARDTIRALFAFTDCEVPISPNLTVIRDNQPVVIGVDTVLRCNTEQLKVDLEKELTIELGRLRDRLHAHLLEQIFIEERLYKQIEECTSYEAVLATLDAALVPYAERLLRPVVQEDLERLLEIRIKRISRYDIDKKKKDIKEIETSIRQVQKHLRHLVDYAIEFLDRLLTKYGHLYPRRTELETFQEVDARQVALSNLHVGYHREGGFIGHQVKERDDISFACSELDRLLLIFRNGMYKVVNVPDKLFVGSDLLWAGKVDDKLTFNVIYREGASALSYIKRFKTPKFILDKEYRLFPEHRDSVVQYLSLGEGKKVRVYCTPSRRAKTNIFDHALDDYLVKGVAALGKRLSSRTVRRIVEQEEPAPVVTPTSLGLFEGGKAPEAKEEPPEK